MTLEGVVTNVAAFGAFVDVGVHQDGLVHVSAMSHNFVKDPREVVKSGDVVKVKVMEVDIPRQRIGLSLRLDDEPGVSAKDKPRSTGGSRGGGSRGGGASRGGDGQDRRQQPRRDNRGGRQASVPAGGSMADALRKAGFGK